MKTTEILWTGGFDSTYRVCQLSLHEIVIQPHYISNARVSESYELNAIRQITEILINSPKTKCEFAPLIIHQLSDYSNNKTIIETYEKVLEKDYFGKQYSFLACFALSHKEIELSIHQDDKAIAVIEKYGKLKLNKTNNIEYHTVDTDNSSENIKILFGNFHLPLVDMTKLDMKKGYIDMGYMEIMNLTWFCHSPINGKPCGICNPCKYTIEEKMKERFSARALLRHYMLKYPFLIKRYLVKHYLIVKLKPLIKRILKRK